MRIFLTGATGFVGRALALRLRRQGHELVAMVRSLERASLVLERDVELVDASDDAALRGALARCDAVVNLAGEPVAGRWSTARKARLRASRVGLTERLGRLAAESGGAVRAWIQASAVGYYGSTGAVDVTEDSAPGRGDFLAQLCVDWEAAGRAAADGIGCRYVGVRIGVVFGMGGGALHAMLPAFRLGLGGPLGGGRQVMPWIHLRDLVEVLSEAVIDERYEGAVNATAPNPVEQRELATSLGEVLGRPARLPAPALALKLVLGEAAQIVTTGQRALPTRLTELGFRYRFPALKPALADLVAPPDIRFQAAADWPDVPYLRRRRPRYLLSADVTLASGVDEVWPFFSRPENLGVLTPATMAADILQVPDQLSAGALVEYRIRVGPVPMRWRSRIDEWEPGEGFADAQLKGPYACWYHEHGFRPADGGDATLVTDRVWYAPPLGPLGALANTLLVRPMLRDIFSYRRQALALRFGGRRDGP